MTERTMPPLRRRIAVFLGALAAAATLAYCAVLAVLAIWQTDLMYPAPDGGVRTPQTGWRMETVSGRDGPLVAYHLPARSGMPTVIFLHGNATDYHGTVVATKGIAARGMGVLIPEYPGYGGNPGTPSEASLARAADGAYDWLIAKGVPAGRIVLYGNSVGSGPAIHAARRPHAALVLVSGVDSMVDVVRHHYPFAPGFLVRDRYENARGLRAIRGPVLVVHARDDQVVPFTSGIRLAAAARVKLRDLPTGGHAIAFDAATSTAVAQWITDNSNQS